jgi:hypothetical protein
VGVSCMSLVAGTITGLFCVLFLISKPDLGAKELKYTILIEKIDTKTYTIYEDKNPNK